MRQLYVIILFALFSADGVVQAQGVDWDSFFDFEPGDEWVYHQYGGRCPHSSTGEPCTSYDRVDRFQAVRDTVIDGSVATIFRGPEGEGAFGVSEDGRAVIWSGSGYPFLHRPPLDTSVLSYGGDAISSLVYIGGAEYSLYNFTSGNWSYANRIGAIGGGFAANGSGGQRSWYRADLLYCRIDGVEYGTDPMATSSIDLLEKVDTRILAYPNPARDGITLRYTQPPAHEVLVEVVDVLGRVATTSRPAVVARGGAESYVSLRHLPGGTYFVRLTADGIPLGAVNVTKVSD
jgi:hypothetical protein